MLLVKYSENFIKPAMDWSCRKQGIATRVILSEWINSMHLLDLYQWQCLLSLSELQIILSLAEKLECCSGITIRKCLFAVTLGLMSVNCITYKDLTSLYRSI